MEKICVIYNPAAQSERALGFRHFLDELRPQALLWATEGPRHATDLAAQAIREDVTVLVAAGGDGTLNEVLNGLCQVPGAWEKVALGILPLGTINVFAKELRIPSALNKAWDVIRGNRRLKIDLPRCRFIHETQERILYFAQLAGAGFDAEAVRRVNWKLKKRYGWFSYVLAGLGAMRGPLHTITCSTSSETVQGECILIGNGRYYGGRLPLFPEADLADGLFEITIFPRVTWLALAKCGAGLLCRIGKTPFGATLIRAPQFTLSSSWPVPFQVEGEIGGVLPVHFDMLPKALSVIVP